VLALAGSDDNRFAAHALRLAGLVPHGIASLIPGGGHAVHLAQPEAAGRIVRHWLDAAGASPA
jgi:pimeloyl-ACP methyl ester carboxylesterase